MKPFSVFLAKPSGGGDFFLTHAKPYYETYTQDGDLPVAFPPTVLGDSSWLTLLSAIAAANNTHVLIVSHASDRNGLMRFIGPKPDRKHPKPGDASWARMALLLHALWIRAAVRKIKDPSQPEDWYAAHRLATPRHFELKSAVEALRTITHVTQARSPVADKFRKDVEKFRRDFADDGTPPPPKSPAFEKIDNIMERATAASLCNRAKQDIEHRKAVIRTVLGMDQQHVDAYLDAMDKVHAVKLSRVEIRGCNLGKNVAVMTLLALFLGAGRLRAPRVQDTFARTTLRVQAKIPAFSHHKTGHAEHALKGSTTRHFGITFELNGLPASGDQLFLAAHGAVVFPLMAEDLNAARQFIEQRIGKLRGKALNDGDPIFLQFLNTMPPIFPQDYQFNSNYMADVRTLLDDTHDSSQLDEPTIGRHRRP